MTNCYKILGVPDFASAEEIKTAYRKLSKKFHPDLNNGDKFFEDRFKELQNAYETLSDSYRKEYHDNQLKNNYSFNTIENKQTNTTENINTYTIFNQPAKKNFRPVLPMIIFIITIVVVAIVLAHENSGTSSSNSYTIEYFKLGSTRDEVLQLQGKPTSIQKNASSGEEIWIYELSSITFRNGHVSEYSNTSQNLKIHK
ncbi:J domain-containing protein [Chitinophaga silvatica]|uniref:J domain-containing protein n=1 Tax=Chitinophaga silvatica TaxID=2282649 RepID=A0A3E1YHR5_9BACT|nr:J domain-containing protein [Chitinophaga silvatica]RFS26922.1 J domain-containing protein [Chitinophaga silvatica]